MILSTITVILVLGGLIFFHELGHFIVARLLGVGVKAFSLGFGPRLFGWTSGGTEYKLSLVPLGGYVQLAGESGEQESGFRPEQHFMAKPPALRMLVVAAGPVFNFFLAFLIYWFVFASQGMTVLQPTIGKVLEDTPAQAAGLRPGDRILAINGRNIEYFEQLMETVQGGKAEPLTLSLDRDGQTVTTTLTPAIRSVRTLFGDEEQMPMIGILASGDTLHVPLDSGGSFDAAMEKTWNSATFILRGLRKMVEGVVPAKEIGGPIMIAQAIGQQAHNGLVEVLVLAAFISVNLGVINLLPIPILDGGHLLFFAMEIVLRRPVDEKLRGIALRIGMALLFGLLIFATFNDLMRVLT